MKANVYDENQAFHANVPQSNGTGKPTSPKTRGNTKSGSAKWLITALLLLSAIPLTAGAFRLIELAGGASSEITPANARFFASPIPVVVHIVGAAIYAILGSFQFSNRFRRRRPGWHRVAGRVLVGCGLMVGLSALWMTLFYPHPTGDGVLLFVFRLVFGSAMVVSIILGFVAIRRGDVAGHKAWMMRAYAIGLGAGTQPFTLMVGGIIAGPANETSRALLMGAAWVINLAVAEWAIRRNRNRKRPTSLAQKTA